MKPQITDADLEAYLDEALPIELMADLERLLRSDTALAQRFTVVHARRDAGVHSLSAIWRRHRLSCPTREQLGNLLLGVADEELSRFIRFHMEVVGCRACQANWLDLERRQKDAPEQSVRRRKKYFESSAGRLPKA